MKSNSLKSSRTKKKIENVKILQHVDIGNGDDKDYYLHRISDDDENDTSNYAFDEKNNGIWFKHTKKGRRFLLQDKNVDKKYCMSSPFGKQLGYNKCNGDFKYQLFEFVEEGRTYKKPKLPTKVFGYNQIKAIGGGCATSHGKGKSITIQNCKEDNHKYFFKINIYKKTKFYTIETEKNKAVQLGKDLFEKKDGTLKLFRIKWDEGSFKIMNEKKNLCLTRKIDHEDDSKYFKFQTCNLNNFDQAFTLVGYHGKKKAKTASKSTAKKAGKK